MRFQTIAAQDPPIPGPPEDDEIDDDGDTKE
jgi:hypothetical protein